jgi:hypothetical protein
MKKELLIIVYKINIANLTRQHAEEQMQRLISLFNLSKDEDLKEDYHIREIWLPITEGQSDVKVIYPVIHKTEMSELIDEIDSRMENVSDNSITTGWKKLIRELKLRKIEIEL